MRISRPEVDLKIVFIMLLLEIIARICAKLTGNGQRRIEIKARGSTLPGHKQRYLVSQTSGENDRTERFEG